MTRENLFLGVDVGTGSARAGLFDGTGQMVSTAACPIRLWREGENIVEQSSADIWAAVCRAVAQAIGLAGVDMHCVKGIGFAATCSLVVVGPQGNPLTTSLTANLTGDPVRDVIVWMDHRAADQAQRINMTGGAPLAYVGNCISPEMQLPKLLWLKENLPDSFAQAQAFMDLTDYLTWRATGSATRSSCTLTCKWTYLPHLGGWDAGFFESVGLGCLAADGFGRIGTDVAAPGAALGQGLSVLSAQELGLLPGTPVAAGLIDAHAGGLGSLPPAPLDGSDGEAQVAYVFGTSACLMVSSATPVQVPGIWGPYWSAMLPDTWLLEGGQTAAGAAIDFVLRGHPAWGQACADATADGKSLLAWLERRVAARHPSLSPAAVDAARMHYIVDFAGNRSPLADPAARGLVSGQSLSNDVLSLEQTYIAAVLGVAYGARHMLAALQTAGLTAPQIVISGGAAKSPLVRQLLADATGVPVARPMAAEPVLLGAAMLGAVAAGSKAGLDNARSDMVTLQDVTHPNPDMTRFHDWKFRAYRMLQDTERQLWADYDRGNEA